MNPKDMTEEALFEACITAVRAWPDARTVDEGDRLWKLYKDTKAEILVRLASRLDDADALRKENEELAKWLERAWLYLCKLCKNHPSWVTVRSLRDAIRFAIAAHRARIEASKESEASHE